MLAEMARGGVLFNGDSEIDLLFRIFQVLGTPDTSTWPDVDSLRNYNPQFPRWKAQPTSRYSGPLGAEGRSMLEGLLALDPAKRLTATEALEHPFFDGMDDATAQAIAAREYAAVVGHRGPPPPARYVSRAVAEAEDAAAGDGTGAGAGLDDARVPWVSDKAKEAAASERERQAASHERKMSKGKHKGSSVGGVGVGAAARGGGEGSPGGAPAAPREPPSAGPRGGRAVHRLHVEAQGIVEMREREAREDE